MKRIEGIYGPFQGQLIDVEDADADSAIKDGWARDPYAPASTEAPATLTQEELDAVLVKSEIAARKMRGIVDKPAKRQAAKSGKKDDDKAEARPVMTEDLKAGETSAVYKTRGMKGGD